MPSPVAHAFFHTNRPISSPSFDDLAAHTGWWADTHNMREYEVRTTKLFKRDEFPYHAKFAGLQGWKYQWLAASTARAAVNPTAFAEPWLLMDTDTVVQCSGAELRERFLKFGKPLVIGAEFNWWPKRDKLALARGADPWPVQPPPFLRYPNSGLLAGTRDGFQQLEAAFKSSSPRYPCCPRLHNGTRMNKCHIDDQHCLQSALLLSTSPVEYALDANASLFLNLNGVPPSQIVRGADGRCVYTPTGVAPCVFHSNGKAAKPLMQHVFKCKRADAWVVPTVKGGKAGNTSSAAALFSTTHR